MKVIQNSHRAKAPINPSNRDYQALMHVSAAAFAFNFLIAIHFIINTWRNNGSECLKFERSQETF